MPDHRLSQLDQEPCPQNLRCWGPWYLNTDVADGLYLFDETMHDVISLWQPQSASGSKTMSPALNLAFYSNHMSQDGPDRASGIVNAMGSIYRLGYPDGGDLYTARYTAKQVAALVAAAIDNPANWPHLVSFAEVQRTNRHRFTLDQRGQI
jgi:hypothetical protein